MQTVGNKQIYSNSAASVTMILLRTTSRIIVRVRSETFIFGWRALIIVHLHNIIMSELHIQCSSSYLLCFKNSMKCFIWCTIIMVPSDRYVPSDCTFYATESPQLSCDIILVDSLKLNTTFSSHKTVPVALPNNNSKNV